MLLNPFFWLKKKNCQVCTLQLLKSTFIGWWFCNKGGFVEAVLIYIRCGKWRWSRGSLFFELCFCYAILFLVLKIDIFLEVMMAVTSSCKDKFGMDSGKYVRYTPEQVEALERLYHECPKPSSLRRQQLIRECPILSNIEPKQIKVWFQNRRYWGSCFFFF